MLRKGLHKKLRWVNCHCKTLLFSSPETRLTINIKFPYVVLIDHCSSDFSCSNTSQGVNSHEPSFGLLCGTWEYSYYGNFC